MIPVTNPGQHVNAPSSEKTARKRPVIAPSSPRQRAVTAVNGHAVITPYPYAALARASSQSKRLAAPPAALRSAWQRPLRLTTIAAAPLAQPIPSPAIPKSATANRRIGMSELNSLCRDVCLHRKSAAFRSPSPLSLPQQLRHDMTGGARCGVQGSGPAIKAAPA
jgi:hypothetical protein